MRELAERLRQSGVDVTLDQWDLPYGADVVRFMDLGIRDADRVLMVCAANYVAKAEERKGGAGYEGMIVPIVRGNSGEPLVPGFLGQRLWLDFRDDGVFEERLEELLRELHGEPRYVKPPLGRNPFAGPAPDSAPPAASAASVTPAFGAPQPASPATATCASPLALGQLTVPSAHLRRDGEQWQVERQEVRMQACEVELGEGESLRLIQIRAGEFVMGSPADEIDRASDEGPLHRVRLAGFLLGQTPVTQAQWAAVARWPRVELDLKPDPSHFQGVRRPVEQVSWEQAMEFCCRLSQRNGLSFTLPSEAQWEFACRAGTSSPFAFGATLTPELANYDARISYAEGPKGRRRAETTDVASFPANGWGLHDMHGNVWEWCLDTWHDSYQGAPTDGSPWITGDSDTKLLRGGSWNNDPGDCRSAYRSHDQPGSADSDVGFRVVCLPQGPSLTLKPLIP